MSVSAIIGVSECVAVAVQYCRCGGAGRDGLQGGAFGRVFDRHRVGCDIAGETWLQCAGADGEGVEGCVGGAVQHGEFTLAVLVLGGNPGDPAQLQAGDHQRPCGGGADVPGAGIDIFLRGIPPLDSVPGYWRATVIGRGAPGEGDVPVVGGRALERRRLGNAPTGSPGVSEGAGAASYGSQRLGTVAVTSKGCPPTREIDALAVLDPLDVRPHLLQIVVLFVLWVIRGAVREVSCTVGQVEPGEDPPADDAVRRPVVPRGTAGDS